MVTSRTYSPDGKHTSQVLDVVLCRTLSTRIPTPPDGDGVPSLTQTQHQHQGNLEALKVTTVIHAGLQNGSFGVVICKMKTFAYTSHHL